MLGVSVWICRRGYLFQMVRMQIVWNCYWTSFLGRLPAITPTRCQNSCLDGWTGGYTNVLIAKRHPFNDQLFLIPLAECLIISSIALLLFSTLALHHQQFRVYNIYIYQSFPAAILDRGWIFLGDVRSWTGLVLCVKGSGCFLISWHSSRGHIHV